jgi:enterochelin esterase-like enzyme
VGRPHSPIEILDPDLGDPRLAAVGAEPVAWADDGVLTVAVRRTGEAPLLTGTVYERMRPAGEGCWALRLRVPRLARACVEYGVVDPTLDYSGVEVWRGPNAGPAAARVEVAVSEPEAIADSELAAAHLVRIWTPGDPRALLVCADGEGLAAWAGVIAASGEQVALVGIESAGLSYRLGEEYVYDRKSDPRARAYLPDVDPPYFAAHMNYVLETVVPWAEEQLGRLPRIAFGVSNGAVWAAAAGALHPHEFSGVMAFSLGAEPPRPARRHGPVHALVAGQLEPGFHRTTTLYAWKLRTRGVRVRLRRPVRGHDHSMWQDELLPALRWALGE